MKVTGFLRGPPLSVNGLVHLTGMGDFQMKQIDAVPDICPLIQQNRKPSKKDPVSMVSAGVEKKSRFICEAMIVTCIHGSYFRTLLKDQDVWKVSRRACKIYNHNG